MDATISEKKETTTIKEGKKGARKWGMLFLKFLMYGGWIPLAIVILAIFFLVSSLSK